MEFKRLFSLKVVLLIIASLMINIFIFVYENHSSYSESQKNINVRKQTDYIKNYQNNIKCIIENAQTLQQSELFSKRNSFAYKNLMETQKAFERVEQVQPQADNDVAILAISEYKYNLFIVVFVMLVVILQIYKERDNGIWQLVHTSGNGRINLVIKRIAIISMMTLTILLINYIGIIAGASIICNGLGSLSNPIQNISKFELCAYPINKLQFLIIFLVCNYLVALTIVLLLFMLFTVFRNRKNVVIGIVAFVIIEYLIFINIESQSVYGIFRDINVFNIVSSICETFMIYKNVGNNWMIMTRSNAVLLTLIVLMVLFCVITIVAYANMYPHGKTSIITKFLDMLNENYQRLLSASPIIVKEIHKTIISTKGILVVIATVLAIIYFSNTGFVQFSIVEEARDELYIKQGGKDYLYFESYINRILKDYNKALKENYEVLEKYNRGEVQLKDLTSSNITLEYYEKQVASIAEYQNKLQYLKQLKSRGINGYMMSDRGYYQTFGKESFGRELIVLIIVQIFAILIANATFLLEKRSGMEKLLRASCSGSKAAKYRKMFALIIVVGTVSMILYAVDYINVLKHYGSPFLTAPVQSLSFMESIELNVNIWQWIVILVLIKTMISVVSAVIVYLSRNIRIKT